MSPKNPRHSPSLAGILPAVVLVALLAGCGKPLPRGDGPSTLTIRPAEIETSTGRLVGRARFELIDYENTCPRIFGRTLMGFRKAVATVDRDDDEALRVVLTPGHRYKLSLDHLGAGDGADRTCGARLWFTAAEGAHYSIRLRSDLTGCKVSQTGQGVSRLEAHPTCEKARSASETAEAAGAPELTDP